MQQHPVPQQITTFQFKLIGDMTIRQFVFLAGGIITGYIILNLPGPFILKLPPAFLTAFAGFAVAFIPIEERPLDRWFVAFLKAVYSPTLFVWKKTPKVPYFFTLDLNWEQAPASFPSSPPGKVKLEEFLKTLPSFQKTGLDLTEENFVKNVLLSFQSLVPAHPPVPHFLPTESGLSGVGERQKGTLLKAALPLAGTINPTEPAITIIAADRETRTIPAVGKIKIRRLHGKVSPKYVKEEKEEVSEERMPVLEVVPALEEKVVFEEKVPPEKESFSQVNVVDKAGRLEFKEKIKEKPRVIFSPVSPVSYQKVEKLEKEKKTLAVEIAQLKAKIFEFTRGEKPAEIIPDDLAVIKKQLEIAESEKERLAMDILGFKELLAQKERKTAPVTPKVAEEEKQEERVRIIPADLVEKRGLPQLTTTANILTGFVKDARGEFLPNVILIVKNQRNVTVRAFKTNTLGQFVTATPLPNGVYTIELEDPKNTFRFDIIEIRLDGTVLLPLEITAIDERKIIREELNKKLFGST